MSYSNYGLQQPKQNSGLKLFTLIVCGLLVLLLWRHGYLDQPNRPIQPPNQDQQVAPEPIAPDGRGNENAQDEKLTPGPLNVNGHYLIVIEETDGRPVERQLILDHHAFWYGLRDRGMGSGKPDDPGYERFDPEDPEASSYVTAAKRRDVSTPFVMLVDDVGNVKKVVPFPKSVAAIEALLK